MTGPARHEQVLLDRQAREQVPALGHQRDAQRDAHVRRQGRDVAAVEVDRAASRVVGARDRAQQGRLAGSVCPHERNGLAVIYGETDPAHGLQQAVADLDVAQLEKAHAALPR